MECQRSVGEKEEGWSRRNNKVSMFVCCHRWCRLRSGGGRETTEPWLPWFKCGLGPTISESIKLER